METRTPDSLPTNRAAIMRGIREAVDPHTSGTFAEALHILALQIRMAIGAHQSAVSYVPLGEFHAAVHTHSFSEKYEKYNSYDVMPTGSGIWALVVQQKLAVRMTQEELAAHPMWKKFSDMRNQRAPAWPARARIVLPFDGRSGI